MALDSITAHLDVFRQREVTSLAEKNLQIHRDIYQSLAEREQAGAGSIADVTQAQARLARAESTLYLSQADLKRTIANYTQVVGVSPGKLAYAADPETLPGDLASILKQMEQRNPELLAVAAEKAEANSRLTLARVNYKPKIDLELSSRYNDQLEGNSSWQNSNAAMLNLRWNLFNGGADRAGISAARSRKSQSQAKYAAKLNELTEETATAWANYVSLQRQRTAYLDAVNFSRKTFDAYLKQFSVSQRSLLDVLSAENDYFQSAVQLITVDINTTLAAYQLLSLSGNIQPSRCPDNAPEYYQELRQALTMSGSCSFEETNKGALTTELSSGQGTRQFGEKRAEIAADSNPTLRNDSFTNIRQEILVSQDSSAHTANTGLKSDSAALQTLKIGPCLNRREVELATTILNHYAVNAQQSSGAGLVAIVRLLEGTYSPSDARKRLITLKRKVPTAFLLPQGAQLGLYAGSFHEEERATKFVKTLAQKQIEVTKVPAKVELHGKMLLTKQLEQHMAMKIAAELKNNNLPFLLF